MTTSNNWENAPKAPTNEGVPVWNKSQRDALRRTKAFRERNPLWAKGTIPGTKNHRFNAFARVGKMAEIVVKANAKTYNEFALYYINNVRSWETIQSQAKEWFEFCIQQGCDITPEEALAEHIVHILDQTWEGWHRENLAAENLAKLTGKVIGRPSYEWDVDFAIDLIEVDEVADDGFTQGYQIKPATFFSSTQWSVAKARQENCIKHAAAEKRGKEPYFINGDELARGIVNLIHYTELMKQDQQAA